MSLKDAISENHKEIVGSRTKNRLTVQLSCAVQLIMEFYTTDYLILMDYIEDISVVENPENPSDIHLYQVKTKTADKSYLLSAIINNKWYQKLYQNAQKYATFLSDATVICNADVVHSGEVVFENEKTSLKDIEINKNIKKIKNAIAKDLKIKENDVDLSKFYFVRSNLSVKGHKNEVEYEFEDFLLSKDPELQVATVKSIYRLIYDRLDEKFNNEISENCTDINEIFSKKGLNGREVKDIISCGLAVQLPTLEKLFHEFGITNITEIRKYKKQYTFIKTDTFSSIDLFIRLKKDLMNLIEIINESGVDKMSDLLDYVYSRAQDEEIIPSAYNEEYYIRMLIMVLIYKYCFGVDN